jgi:hypothetical protein
MFMTDNQPDPTTPQTGSIIVNSIPAGAAIQLDGKDTGKVTPATLENIEKGRHKVAVNLPDHCLISKEITVTGGSTVSVCLKKFTPEELKRIHFIGYYTAGWIIILIVIAVLTRRYQTMLDNLTTVIIYVACSGGLGSLAFSIFGYMEHLGKGDFDLNYLAWYYLRPMIGIIYGTFAFFFVAGGLMALSGTSAPVSESLFTTKSVMFYCALAFLAGYAEYSFSLQLKELSEAVFKKGDNTQQPNGK